MSSAQFEIIGDDPLVNGMVLSMRMRRDFTVTDADRLLVAARRLYREMYPDTSAAEAAEMVTCAADVLFTIFEHAGLLGHPADAELASHTADGLAIEGDRAQVVINEPNPLPPNTRCWFGGTEDVFALPESGH
jgi:hypothetical protein